VGDIDFEVISAAEKIQINSKKPGFGRKNQLRTLYSLIFLTFYMDCTHKEHITFPLPMCLFQYFQVCNVWSSVSIYIRMLGQKAMNVHQCFLSLWSKASGLWLFSRETDYQRLRRSKMP